MLYEIKHRITGEILFSVEIEDAEGQSTGLGLAIKAAIKEGADLRGADLRGAALSMTDMRGADLREANLRWSDLQGADLRGAALSMTDMRGADLREADLRGDNLNVLQTSMWTAYIQPDYIRIGRQCHSADDWFGFSDEVIDAMSPNALAWWKRWKPTIQLIHKTLIEGGSHV